MSVMELIKERAAGLAVAAEKVRLAKEAHKAAYRARSEAEAADRRVREVGRAIVDDLKRTGRPAVELDDDGKPARLYSIGDLGNLVVTPVADLRDIEHVEPEPSAMDHVFDRMFGWSDGRPRQPDAPAVPVEPADAPDDQPITGTAVGNDDGPGEDDDSDSDGQMYADATAGNEVARA